MSTGAGRELWLVRHGQTPASLGRRLAGWGDVPLTPRGEEQASALRPVLEGERFDGVWSSDLRRAVRTARLAWGEPRPDRRLREMSFGALEGAPYDTLEERWQLGLARFEGFAPPGGETFDDLRARVLSFVDELLPGRHLVFTHGGVVRLLSREAGEDRFVPTGTLLVLDWEARRLVSRRDGEGNASQGLPGGGAAPPGEAGEGA
jgi:2,3-bisphosphoglycerate-dependent phosphoglycerate mutase